MYIVFIPSGPVFTLYNASFMWWGRKPVLGFILHRKSSWNGIPRVLQTPVHCTYWLYRRWKRVLWWILQAWSSSSVHASFYFHLSSQESYNYENQQRDKEMKDISVFCPQICSVKRQAIFCLLWTNYCHCNGAYPCNSAIITSDNGFRNSPLLVFHVFHFLSWKNLFYHFSSFAKVPYDCNSSSGKIWLATLYQYSVLTSVGTVTWNCQWTKLNRWSELSENWTILSMKTTLPLKWKKVPLNECREK